MILQNSAPPRVCAAVVAYHPDPGFEARLTVVASQVDALVVVDNTLPAARQRRIAMPMVAGGRTALLVENPDNLGIAVALNQGLRRAQAWGCAWLLTLDQDSCCYPDMVQSLLAVAGQTAPEVMVIGGNYLDPRNSRTQVAPGQQGQYLEQKTVITSASLVKVAEALRLHGFREDYFIDQVDHEFCLRVRAQGGKVVITRKVVMEHSVGEAGGAWLPLVGYLPQHAPIRKYYLARNSIVTIAGYWRKEPNWCVRRALRLVLGAVLTTLLERRRWPTLRAYVFGFSDGLRGRMGTRSKLN